MRVSILTSDLNIRGGTQKQVLRLAQYLQSKYPIDIYTYSYVKTRTYTEFSEFNIQSLSVDNLQSVFLSPSWFRLWKFRIRLVAHLSSNQQIVNVHDNGFQFVIILLKIINPRIVIVWQINDLPGHFNLGINRRIRYLGPARFVGRLSTFIALRVVDEITVNVTKNMHRIQRISGRKPLVFYCGIDSSPCFHQISGNQLTPSRDSIFSTGVCFRYRNYETIPFVLAELKKRFGLDMSCKIVGEKVDLDYVSEVQAIAKKANVRLEFLGAIDDESLSTIKKSSLLFLFLNIDQSWGLSVFEALAGGIPVIISNSVGATEILQNSDCVQIVDPLNTQQIIDSILNIVRLDANGYHRLALKCIDVVSDMSWEKMYSSKIDNLFKSLHFD